MVPTIDVNIDFLIVLILTIPCFVLISFSLH